MVKTYYKDNFDLKGSKILKTKNVLSFNAEIDEKGEYLPLINLSKRLWFQLWFKSLFNKVYLLVTPHIDNKTFSIDFIKIKNELKEDNK